MSKKMRNRVLLLLCVVLVLSALACGGGGGDNSSLSDVCGDRLETNEQIGSIFE